MMISNPEFRRNIWLEMTAHRLIAMPLILSILLILAYLSNGSLLNQSVADGAQLIALTLTTLWGGHMAAESLLSEVREHTWDGQRMSAMPAWTLMWGKLLGSTIYTWYGSFFCMLVYIFASEMTWLHTLQYALLIVFIGLLGQALAMLLAMMVIRKSEQVLRSPSILIVMFSAGFTWTLFSMVANATRAIWEWYGMLFEPINFGLCSVIIFLSWAWMGNYRLMRTELQVKHGIWAWLGFVIFLMFYMSGFFYNIPWVSHTQLANLSTPLLTAFIVAASLTYVMLFAESKDPVNYKRLLRLFSEVRWVDLQFHLPCWVGACFLTILSGLILSLQMLSQGISPMFIFAAVLFILRDICFVLYLNFNVNRKRADMAAILYIFILYAVIPSMFSLVDLPLAALFLPYHAYSNGWISVIAALLECMIVFWLMRYRWLKNYSVC